MIVIQTSLVRFSLAALEIDSASLAPQMPGITLLDNGKIQDRQVWGDDASPDSLPAPLTPPAPVPSEAGIAWGHQQVHTILCEHTLLHWESLLILAAHDFEDIALELLQI